MLVDIPAAQHKKIFFIAFPSVNKRQNARRAVEGILGSDQKTHK